MKWQSLQPIISKTKPATSSHQKILMYVENIEFLANLSFFFFLFLDLLCLFWLFFLAMVLVLTLCCISSFIYAFVEFGFPQRLLSKRLSASFNPVHWNYLEHHHSSFLQKNFKCLNARSSVLFCTIGLRWYFIFMVFIISGSSLFGCFMEWGKRSC